jgi:tRNA pseudouridine55 synthase
VVDVDIEVTVSSGTYVRALARDLGIALACGGHLTALRRTRVGGFGLDAAHPLDELMAIEGPMPVIPLAQAAAAAFRTRTLSDQEEWKVGVGQRIASEEPGRLGPVAAITKSGRLAALLDEQASTARSLVVFPAE